MHKQIQENNKINIMNGEELIWAGAEMQQTLIGAYMLDLKPIITTIHGDGDLHGAGMAVIAHTGV